MIAERLSAQLLTGVPAASVEAVVERLLAVQAQDARGARLSVRCRSAGLRAADVDSALTRTRSMVVTWVNRGTLHLVRGADYWWLFPLTTPQLATANRRRLAQEGVSPEQAVRAVEVIADAVGSDGALTRAQLRARLEGAGIPTAGQALVHELVAATLDGRIVRGPMRGSEQAFVAVGEWLGEAPPPLERGDGLGRLARRYLAGHGPADAGDLAKWAGVPLRDARMGFAAIAEELTGRANGLVDLAGRGEAEALPPPRLHGAFDPLLLGWASRDALVGEHRVVTTNGLFRPFALVDGRVVATWGVRGSTVRLTLLEHVAEAAVEALIEDAADVRRFLGLAEGTTDVTRS